MPRLSKFYLASELRRALCFQTIRVLAFAERVVDKMQLAKVLRLANISLKIVGGLQRVVEFLSFQDGLLEILDSPIFMPKSFWVDIRALFDDEIKS